MSAVQGLSDWLYATASSSGNGDQRQVLKGWAAGVDAMASRIQVLEAQVEHERRCVELLEAIGSAVPSGASAPAPTLQQAQNPPYSIPFPAPSERDWTEDASHENGNYMNVCCHCEKAFIGHKRRLSCKVCSSSAPAPAIQQSSDVDLLRRALTALDELAGDVNGFGCRDYPVEIATIEALRTRLAPHVFGVPMDAGGEVKHG